MHIFRIMSKPFLFLLLIMSATFCGCSDKSANVTIDQPAAKTTPESSKTSTENADLKVGAISTKTAVFRNGAEIPFYFNMHGDEQTSSEAVKNIISGSEGKLLVLNTNGERLIKFQAGNNSYSFDPNRIFTPLGIKKTLEKYDSYTPENERQVDAFSKKIIEDFLTGRKMIVAVHNNTDENYSILSYASGGEYEADAAQIYINPELDADDFFLVTSEDIFRVLKERNFNVVLQDNNNVVDDGSLSVYCAKNDIIYINVESEHNHLSEQINMLNNLKEIIARF